MDKAVYLSMPKDVTHGRGYIYSLQYHIIWVTKYRKPIFVGEIEKDVRNYLLETLKSLDMVPIAMEIMPDHIQNPLMKFIIKNSFDNNINFIN